MVGDYERRFILLFNMNSMTRREAARLIGGTTAGLLLPISASRAQLANKSLTVLTRAIPSSGEKLPVIGLGTWRTFDVDLTADNRKQLAEVLSLFVKLVGRVIDSSPMYGRSEQVIGELATQLGLHQQLFLATKVWTRGKQAGIESMERSVARLQTKRVDLMQVHNLVDVATQLATMRDWKAQGRIRRSGKSSAERETRFRSDQLFDHGARSGRAHSSACARSTSCRDREPAVRRRRSLQSGSWQTDAGLGR